MTVSEEQQAERLKSFPLSWVTTGRHLLLVGGGPVGENRLCTAVQFDWEIITVVAEDPTERMLELAACDSRVVSHRRPATEEDIGRASLVIENTEDHVMAEKVAEWCKKHRVPINAMDKMDLCDLHYPAFLRRGPMLIAISSGGEAPALSARLKKWLDEKLSCGWCHAAWNMARARRQLPQDKERMAFLKRISGDPRLLEWIETNSFGEIETWIDDEADKLRIKHTAS